MGVKNVRRSTGVPEELRHQRLLTASEAAEASPLFPKGGSAFVEWCRQQGFDPDVKRAPEVWKPHLEAFAARPVHGHRRQAGGGNHRINTTDKR